jgi:AcrR family transcriptional regulator
MTKPMRADARRNHERLVAVAKTAFAEHGADAPLEDIARRAEVGIGTLYRHFPERNALMAAVFQNELEALIALATDLCEADGPLTALTAWLRAVISHIRAYRGLCQSLIAAQATSMDTCKKGLRTAGDALLRRAQFNGDVRADARVQDLLQLTCAIALVAERSPEDPQLADRMLSFAVDGLRVRPTTP